MCHPAHHMATDPAHHPAAQAVEKYFMGMGWLLPTFHKTYWIGLNATTPGSKDAAGMVAGMLTTASPGRFAWLDQSAGAPGNGSYTHWGRAGGMPEPNNLRGSENCGMANASQSHGSAWGWSDTSCKISAPFICRSLREWPAPRGAGHAARTSTCHALPAACTAAVLLTPGSTSCRAGVLLCQLAVAGTATRPYAAAAASNSL
jgi:hypothetical protein